MKVEVDVYHCESGGGCVSLVKVCGGGESRMSWFKSCVCWFSISGCEFVHVSVSCLC